MFIICLWTCVSTDETEASSHPFYSSVCFDCFSYPIDSDCNGKLLFPISLCSWSTGRPCVRPGDITSSACEGSVLAVSCRGRQQSCLGFPWQLEDIQLLHVPLLNSIQILWNPALALAPSLWLSLTNSCPLWAAAAVSSFIEWSWNTWFLWASSVCAFFYVLNVCSAIAVAVFYVSKWGPDLHWPRQIAKLDVLFWYATLWVCAEGICV